MKKQVIYIVSIVLVCAGYAALVRTELTSVALWLFLIENLILFISGTVALAQEEPVKSISHIPVDEIVQGNASEEELEHIRELTQELAERKNEIAERSIIKQKNRIIRENAVVSEKDLMLH